MKTKQILIYLLRGIGTLFQFLGYVLGDTFNSMSDTFSKQEGYTATFGKETDIASRFNKGYVISKHRRLTLKKSFENVILCSQTGGGKTSRYIIKQLLELKNCSILLNDPSGEIYTTVSGYLSQYFSILTLNFSDSSVSSGYNFLAECKTGQDVNKIADILVRATIDKGNSNDPFWGLQSRNTASIFIRLVLHQPEEYRTMLTVLHLVKVFASQPKVIDLMVVRTKDEKLILDYKTLVAMPEKTRQNVLATTLAALSCFDNEELARVCSYHTINLNKTRKIPTIIFLLNKIGSMEFTSIPQSIFFTQFYNHYFEYLPQKDDLPLHIILEEASSLYIKGFPTYICNTRKHQISNFICTQSLQNLKSQYGEASQTIFANCGVKIFLPGITDVQTLKEIEVLSGKTTVQTKDGKEITKQLVTVDEARLLPDNRTLILSGNTPIIKGRSSPYFKSFKYKRRTSLPPKPLTGDIPDGSVPLIDINSLKPKPKGSNENSK